MSSPLERSSQMSIDEITQAIRGRAGFDVLFPEGARREKGVDFVARLEGEYPDAYDIIAMGVLLEHNRNLKERALDVILNRPNGRPDQHAFDWAHVTQFAILRGLEDLTVSMKGGKGRKEGVEIARNPMLPEQRSRWSWRRD